MGKIKPDSNLQTFKEELIGIVQKSQDIFEKQLSYISAGTLALSIGFVKDLVPNFPKSGGKWFLALGWILLGFTLLLNCISHLVGFYLNNKTIADLNTENANDYDPVKANKRGTVIFKINLFSVSMMILGIGFIIYYVIINTINMSGTLEPKQNQGMEIRIAPQNDINKGLSASSAPSKPQSTQSQSQPPKEKK